MALTYSPPIRPGAARSLNHTHWPEEHGVPVPRVRGQGGWAGRDQGQPASPLAPCLPHVAAAVPAVRAERAALLLVTTTTRAMPIGVVAVALAEKEQVSIFFDFAHCRG